MLSIEEQMISRDIMNLEEMKRFVDDHYSNKMFNYKYLKPSSYIKDDELMIIDGLLDDQIINQLLSYEGYSPAMRDFSASLFLRAEILKAIKYPEISYRKFCCGICYIVYIIILIFSFTFIAVSNCNSI